VRPAVADRNPYCNDNAHAHKHRRPIARCDSVRHIDDDALAIDDANGHAVQHADGNADSNAECNA